MLDTSVLNYLTVSSGTERSNQKQTTPNTGLCFRGFYMAYNRPLHERKSNAIRY